MRACATPFLQCANKDASRSSGVVRRNQLEVSRCLTSAAVGGRWSEICTRPIADIHHTMPPLRCGPSFRTFAAGSKSSRQRTGSSGDKTKGALKNFNGHSASTGRVTQLARSGSSRWRVILFGLGQKLGPLGMAKFAIPLHGVNQFLALGRINAVCR